MTIHKPITKFISIILTLSLVLSLCPIVSFASNGYDTDFDSVTVTDDGKIQKDGTDMFVNVALLGDSTNKYIKGTGKDSSLNAFEFREANAGLESTDIAVLDFDVFLASENEGFEVRVVGNSNPKILNFDRTHGFYIDGDASGKQINVGTVSADWHNIKVLFNYTSPRTYSVFIDNELVVYGTQSVFSLGAKPTANRGIKITTASGVDNFKYYAQTLPFPYDVELKSQPKVGTVVISEVSTHSLGTIASDAYKTEYSYYVSETQNGEYSPITETSDLYVTSGGGLAIFDTSLTGQYLKVGVKTVASDGSGESFIYKSAPVQIASCDKLNLTSGTTGRNVRFKLSSSLGAGALWSLSPSTAEGVAISSDGVISVTSKPLSDVYAVASKANGEKQMLKLNFVENSTDGSALDGEVYPVVFDTVADRNKISSVSAGDLNFDLTSLNDTFNFKLVFDSGKYYAFADNKILSSGESNQKPALITANDSFDSYYAGSPLATNGAFIKAELDSNIYEGSTVSADYSFYNESGVYPDSYTIEWYLQGSRDYVGPQYFVPYGSIGANVYATISANGVTAQTSTASIGSQYELDIVSDATFKVNLTSADKNVYALFSGADKSLYMADMSNGEITAVLTPGQSYTMYFINKADLSLRGMPVDISGGSYTDMELAAPYINYLVRKDAGAGTNTAVRYEKPYTKAELQSELAATSDGYINDIICDVYISSGASADYTQSTTPDFGRFNLISISQSGTAQETEIYKNKAKLFNEISHLAYPNFASLTSDALGISLAKATEICTALGGIADKSRVCSLAGEKPEYFLPAVRFALISEHTSPSDGAVELLKQELADANLANEFCDILKTASSYSLIMSGIDYSQGMQAVAGSMTEKILISETKNALNYKNLKAFFYNYLGSSIYDTAAEDLQSYAAECVHKKTYPALAELKSAVEYAIQNPPVSGGGGGGAPSSKPVQSGSISSGTPTPDISQSPFSDITPGHWAYDYILYMSQRGIMSGYNGLCRPEDGITRAEYAKLLCLTFGIPSANAAVFADVGENDWFAPFVGGAYNAGIVQGNGIGFNPNGGITREDAAVMLRRVLSLKGFKPSGAVNPFTDTDFGSYAIDSVAELAALGIINGITDTVFAPKANITRAQTAKLLYFAINVGGDI